MYEIPYLEAVSHRLTLFLTRFISFTLKMETTCSSETSVHNKPTQRHIPEDGILQNQNNYAITQQ
jgi:hypothetical protein